MATFEIEIAQTILSEMIDRVLAGEEIIISRNGKPVAKLGALSEKNPVMPERRFGGQWTE